MNKIITVIFSIVLLLGLVASSGCASTSTSVGTTKYSAVMPAPVAPQAASGEAASRISADSSAGGTGTSSIDRKIVRTGYITLEVSNIGESMDAISRLASESEGYVISSNKNDNNDNSSGTISIRVPAGKYDEIMGKLRKLAVKVPNEHSDSRDVTQEYTDLNAQLTNLQATEAQYLNLLNKANTVEDILKVQKELSNIRTQIDQIKGRIQYLDRTSDMSLIQISLTMTSSITKKGWDIVEILKSAVNGLIVFAQILLGFIIWAIIFCPFWGGIWLLVWWLVRRRNKKKLSPPESK
jgi:hypothetical protein